MNDTALAKECPEVYNECIRGIYTSINIGAYNTAQIYASAWMNLHRKMPTEAASRKRKSGATERKVKPKKVKTNGHKGSTNKKTRTGDQQKRVKQLFSSKHRQKFKDYGYTEDEKEFYRSLYRQHFADDDCTHDHRAEDCDCDQHDKTK